VVKSCSFIWLWLRQGIHGLIEIITLLNNVLVLGGLFKVEIILGLAYLVQLINVLFNLSVTLWHWSVDKLLVQLVLRDP